MTTVETLLQPFQRFGVHLGLERIQRLLAILDNPQQSMPMIHVAGTNGKGSVCAYLSSILTESGYRVGRYTSPHLINWTERICLNNQPIPEAELIEILSDIQAKIPVNEEMPTQFEILTAAAWVYFARSSADIVVIEVGLGGRLDATNVCDHPLVSVITSLSREHWQQLGPTLADIAREKAGILKKNCPAVIGLLPSEAETVIRSHLSVLNCPTVWVTPAVKIENNWAKYTPQPPLASVSYPLPLLGEIQLLNSAIAIATIQVLQQQGWQISLSAIQQGMAKTQWLGRLQWIKWQDRSILIDGAHNTAAATALRHYVDTLKQPITWVMGMLSTKDHPGILTQLLRNGDRLYLVPVPDHSSADPSMLANLASQACPDLKEIAIFADLQDALNQAITFPETTVLCGSLYLVGYFLSNTYS